MNFCIIRHNGGMNEFDILVGNIAGAIYSDVSRQFPHPPLMLVPAITYKVRRIMEQVTIPSLLSASQKETLAKNIRVSIIPLLFSYDIETDIIERISPTIESAAFRAISKATMIKEIS